jgi:hypothetical protein
MPKVDPDCDVSSTITIAPAPLPPGQTSAAPTLFGASNNATAPVQSGNTSFGQQQSGGFNSSSNGFGGSTTFGTGAFGSSGGFGTQRPGFGQQQVAPDANTTAAFGNMMASSAGHEPEHWMKAFWRPAMGWLYMLICFMDFVAFPLIAMFLPIIERAFGIQMGYTAWQSLTLSNGGLIHLAFGGILGVSAYGRTVEKKTGTS